MILMAAGRAPFGLRGNLGRCLFLMTLGLRKPRLLLALLAAMCWHTHAKSRALALGGKRQAPACLRRSDDLHAGLETEFIWIAA